MAGLPIKNPRKPGCAGFVINGIGFNFKQLTESIH